MNKLKSYFLFSNEQRNGIFLLLLLIIILQLIILNFGSLKEYFNSEEKFSKEDKEWLALQSKFDSLKLDKKETYQLQPFNPNFITDYKGYMLGLSEQELDRLFQFRKQNKYVNSAEEFQTVTKVSDSVLNNIKSYFKFPDWVKEKNGVKKAKSYVFFDKEKPIQKNINAASVVDLVKVYGIGEKLAAIILREKEKLGAFADIKQLQYVWGISPETFENIKNHFFASAETSHLVKLKINDASIKELIKFPYFNYELAREIVTYRSMNGPFKKFEDLTNVKGFPVDKIEIIVLYLELN